MPPLRNARASNASNIGAPRLQKDRSLTCTRVIDTFGVFDASTCIALVLLEFAPVEVGAHNKDLDLGKAPSNQYPLLASPVPCGAQRPAPAV